MSFTSKLRTTHQRISPICPNFTSRFGLAVYIASAICTVANWFILARMIPYAVQYHDTFLFMGLPWTVHSTLPYCVYWWNQKNERKKGKKRKTNRKTEKSRAIFHKTTQLSTRVSECARINEFEIYTRKFIFRVVE